MAVVTHTVASATNPPSQAFYGSTTTNPTTGGQPSFTLTIDDGTNQYKITGPRSQVIALLQAAIHECQGFTVA